MCVSHTQCTLPLDSHSLWTLARYLHGYLLVLRWKRLIPPRFPQNDFDSYHDSYAH
jgi:hypothetical protein